MKEIYRKIYWLLSTQCGIDFRRMVRSLRGIPRFINDWFLFKKTYRGTLDLLPCLYDWYEEGGATKDEYFWQDLYIAREIHRANPERHVDIGSRIDGFVAHVASFREIEVFDIRPVTSNIPGVIFRQADLMNPSESFLTYCDSLSCLHALEHFGLGRYGDPIDPLGHVAGLKNIVRILKIGGILYLSVPIGKARVEFNAHRVLDPRGLIELATANNLLLKHFAFIDTDQAFVHSATPSLDMEKLSQQRYALGIFTFIKQAAGTST